MIQRRPLRVLMISSGFYPKVDGTTLAISNTILGLEARGHTLSLITRRYQGCPKSEYWSSVPVLRAGPAGSSVFSRLALALNLVGVGMPMMLRRRIDVVHVHGLTPLLPGLILGRIFRKPVVVTFHGFQSLWAKETQWRKESTNKIAKPFLKRMVRATNAVIAQSEKFKAVLIQLYDLNPTKIHVIPHFIDEEHFRHCHQPSSDVPEVLFVGTLAKVYGVDLVIKAAVDTKKHNPDVSFVIVGKGPYQKKLEELTSSLEAEEFVSFAGPIFDRERLAEAYCACKVVVIPQKYEGYFLSLVALESMAVGRPVVTTQVLDSELYKVGFFKATFDPEDIAQKIIGILSMKNEQYAELSDAIRSYFDANYSKEAVLSKIETLYFFLVNKDSLAT